MFEKHLCRLWALIVKTLVSSLLALIVKCDSWTDTQTDGPTHDGQSDP